MNLGASRVNTVKKCGINHTSQSLYLNSLLCASTANTPNLFAPIVSFTVHLVELLFFSDAWLLGGSVCRSLPSPLPPRTFAASLSCFPSACSWNSVQGDLYKHSCGQVLPQTSLLQVLPMAWKACVARLTSPLPLCAGLPSGLSVLQELSLRECYSLSVSLPRPLEDRPNVKSVFPPTPVPIRLPAPPPLFFSSMMRVLYLG